MNLKRTFDTFFEKKKENSLMGEDVVRISINIEKRETRLWCDELGSTPR